MGGTGGGGDGGEEAGDADAVTAHLEGGAVGEVGGVVLCKVGGGSGGGSGDRGIGGDGC